MLWLTGCSAPGPTAGNYSACRSDSLDPTSALHAAETALADLGYRIDRLDRTAGLLTASAVCVPSDEDLGRRRLRISARRPTERYTEVRILRTADAVKIYCKVLVRECVTEAHRMFALERRGLDTPGDTPIDREAATTARQNTVWRTIRRDKPSERSILARILDGGASAAQNPPGS